MLRRMFLWTGATICCLAVVLSYLHHKQARYHFANRWVMVLDGPDPQQRIRAAQVLAELLADDVDGQCKYVAYRLMKVRGPEAQAVVPILSKAVRNPNPDIKFAAITVLRGIGPEA